MANGTTFTRGQQVVVNPDKWDQSPAWKGEVVDYWRNGCYIVREPVHLTTCAYDASRLELVD